MLLIKRKFYLFQKKSGKRYEFYSHIKLHNQYVVGSSPTEIAIAGITIVYVPFLNMRRGRFATQPALYIAEWSRGSSSAPYPMLANEIKGIKQCFLIKIKFMVLQPN